MNSNDLMVHSNVKNLIYTIRGKQVMLDRDLANLYGVETKNLNRAVSRNIGRFPEKFRFQLTQDEFYEYEKSLRFQFGTSKSKDKFWISQIATLKENRGGRRYLPYVFTEQGVSMLSAVLRSKTAIKVSIQIIDAFVEMRKFISQNANLFQRINNIEQKQIVSDIKQIKTDNKINQIFRAIEEREITPKKGIFFDGQVFDAFVLISKIVKSAKNSITLIDNYIDESVLTLFSKRKKGVTATIHTRKISRQLKLDIEKFNQQYSAITVKEIKNVHDRFLIIDDKIVYHIGASLKDLGKKWFAFSKMDKEGLKILGRLK